MHQDDVQENLADESSNDNLAVIGVRNVVLVQLVLPVHRIDFSGHEHKYHNSGDREEPPLFVCLSFLMFKKISEMADLFSFAPRDSLWVI